MVPGSDSGFHFAIPEISRVAQSYVRLLVQIQLTLRGTINNQNLQL